MSTFGDALFMENEKWSPAFKKLRDRYDFGEWTWDEYQEHLEPLRARWMKATDGVFAKYRSRSPFRQITERARRRVQGLCPECGYAVKGDDDAE